MTATPLLPPGADGNSARRASAVISSLIDMGDLRPLLIADVLDALHERAFGLALLVFVLPNCLPMPGLPYVSMATGIPLCLFALQLLAGMPRPWLPRTIARRVVPQRRARAIWRRLLPVFRKIERVVRPRQLALTSQTGERLLACVILVLGIILVLPIPAGNLLPAWAILLLALGLMERDGRVVIFGLVTSVIALAWTVAILLAGEQLYLWVKAGLFPI